MLVAKKGTLPADLSRNKRSLLALILKPEILVKRVVEYSASAAVSKDLPIQSGPRAFPTTSLHVSGAKCAVLRGEVWQDLPGREEREP